MSDPMIIATSIVTVVAALTTGLVTVINAVYAGKDRKAAQVDRAALSVTTTSTDRKADTLIEKATEIHTVTNGNLSRVQAQLEIATQQIAALHEKIHSLETLIATMAAATHRRSTDPIGPQEP